MLLHVRIRPSEEVVTPNLTVQDFPTELYFQVNISDDGDNFYIDASLSLNPELLAAWNASTQIARSDEISISPKINKCSDLAASEKEDVSDYTSSS